MVAVELGQRLEGCRSWWRSGLKECDRLGGKSVCEAIKKLDGKDCHFERLSIQKNQSARNKGENLMIEVR